LSHPVHVVCNILRIQGAGIHITSNTATAAFSYHLIILVFLMTSASSGSSFGFVEEVFIVCVYQTCIKLSSSKHQSSLICVHLIFVES